jgi:hypothetical protein
MTEWVVEGERYYSFGTIAKFTGTRCGLKAEQVRGPYAAL